MLDISHNTELTSLDCYNNHLETLDVRSNPHLSSLNCKGNGVLDIWLLNGQIINSFQYDEGIAILHYE